MKTPFPLSIGCCLGCLRWSSRDARAQRPSLPVAPSPAARVEVVERGPHHAVVEWVERRTASDGQVREFKHRYVQLETGLHYQDAQGQWQPSAGRFARHGGRAVSGPGPFAVSLAANVAEEEAVWGRTPEGLELRSRIYGLAYWDPESGQSVLVAELRAAAGWLNPEQTAVVYPDAFTDLKADVRLRVSRAGLEQEVILREAPPPPEAFGLGPRAELQLLTEFFDPPVPRELAGLEAAAARGTNQVAAATATGEAARLSFGALSLGKGRAFRLDAPADAVPVRKSWERLEGRQFLIESVPYPTWRPQLESLPKAAEYRSAWRAPSLREHLRGGGRRVASASAVPEIRLAQTLPERPGVVLDYVLTLTSQNNLTLRADTTYYVTGPVILGGLTTIEGGAVVKYAPTNDAHLRLLGTVQCRTGPYRPAVFTARDDNTVGAVVYGSTGEPVGTYATTALWLDDNVAVLRHLRIAWAGRALAYEPDTGWPQEVWHTQISHCGYGIVALCPELRASNLLLDQVEVNFACPGAPEPVVVRVEHLTSDTAAWLNGSGAVLTLYLTNSLLVNVTHPGNYAGAGNALGASSDFQSVLAGRHYLAPGSPHRDAGTEVMDSRLRAELAELTTEAPALWTAPITTETVWEPWVERDSDLPDRGYHYPPLDFLVSSLPVEGVAFSLAEGVAVGVYGSAGFLLQGPAQLTGAGSPSRLNRLVQYRLVQEDTTAAHGRVHDALVRDNLATEAATVRLRFTEMVLPGGDGAHFSGGATLGSLILNDCELTGGRLDFNLPGTWPRTVALTNNVLDRVNANLGDGQDTTLTVQARNNLFRACASVSLNAAPGTAWAWFDNLFDTTSLWQYYGGVLHGYNAYFNCPNRLLPSGSPGDLSLTALSYTADAWGRRWYAQATPALADAGSRAAAAAGLWHYTTRPDQVREGATPVDVGFHYVAVEPAEVELAVAGTALSASSSYSNGQWNPPRARDGLWTDPGWHNSGYTQPVEWLRADLGEARPVGGVAYVPRVMSASPSDGSWNGVYRRGEIYVTDSASSDPAQWGAPAAVGEWYWPRRQERREVRFAARRGRYVIWRRLEAWGWYTRQFGQSWPGYANANEVAVFPPAPAALLPLDTDGDGLPDFREDADGDGLTGAMETDPNNPDSNHNGLLDGEEQTGPPMDWNKFYSCTSRLDYTSPTSGRHPKYPDTQVQMQWRHLADSWMNVDCSYVECTPPSPPPDFVVGEHRKRQWSDLCCNNGIERVWFTNYARQVYGGEAQGYWAFFPIPRERCVTDFGGDFNYSGAVPDPPMTFTVQRRAETDVRLSVGGKTWPKPLRSVVVRLSAVDKTDGQSLAADHTGCGSNEPNSHWMGQEIDPVHRRYSLNDRPVDAEGRVLLQVPRGTSDFKMRPGIPCMWYQYETVLENPQIVRMTWSRHPQVSSVDLQAKFDAGARTLAGDDNAPIRDSNPEVTPGAPQFNEALYNADDVPTYLEFIVFEARSQCFPPPYDSADYYEIEYGLYLENLRVAEFANIKLVDAINLQTALGVIEYWGWAKPDHPAMVLVSSKVTPQLLIHEYGHMAGLEHRGWLINGQILNPGDSSDTSAVMYSPQEPGNKLPGMGKKVNRFERYKFVSYSPQLWNSLD